MNRKISIGTAIAFAAIVAAAVFSITWISAFKEFNVTVDSLKEREQRYSKIAEIDSYVRQNYINNIQEDMLTDETAAGFIAGLGDPYAQYYDAAAYHALNADYSGNSVQIGIVTAMDDSGYIKITEVYPSSPAQAAGIEVDNLIIKVDDIDVTKENYYDAVTRLKGEPGTKVSIILRKGVEDSTLEMTRRYVEVPSVSNQLLENGVGVIKFRLFNDTTPEQFNKQVNNLIDQGATSLIFDVRDVTSGTLRSVSQILDTLLPKGDIIFSTDKNTEEDTVLATSDAREITLPMAVIVNEKTSGESELFAQVLQDFGKGKLVGVKTAGKGTMQRTFTLTDGSAIRLTTGRYRTPFSPSYDGTGVRPDFEVRLSEEQAALVAVGNVDNDPQLKKAVEAVAGGSAATELVPVETAGSPSSESSTAESLPEADTEEDQESDAASADSSSSEEEQASSENRVEDAQEES